MKVIKSTGGEDILVDDDVYDNMSLYAWSTYRAGGTSYAVRTYLSPLTGKYKTLRFSHMILQPAEGELVDHKNGNGLDNRRDNLRITSSKQNGRNKRLYSTNKSGFKGVSLNKGKNTWGVYIGVDGKNLNLGSFTELYAAAEAYDRASWIYHGAYGTRNIIKDVNQYLAIEGERP